MALCRQFVLVGLLTGLVVAASVAGAAEAARGKTASGAGCMWLAKRVMQALLRDDIVAANDYQEMYRSFVCPTVRLADAFSCVVSDGPPDSAADMREKIDVCWEDPRRAPAPKDKAVKLSPQPKPKPTTEQAAPAKAPAASPKAVPPTASPGKRVSPMTDKNPPYIKN